MTISAKTVSGKKVPLLCLLSLAALLAGPTWSAEDEHGFVVVQKDEMDLHNSTSDNIETILLAGNPREEGLYIMRIRFPAGKNSFPHHHSQDRYITVIEGTWYAGTQKEFDMDKTVAIPAGGFMKHPAGAVHFDGAKDEATIVEIRGMGPVSTTSVRE